MQTTSHSMRQRFGGFTSLRRVHAAAWAVTSFLLAGSGCARADEASPATPRGRAPEAAVHFSHAALDTVLSRHLRNGHVDYGALLNDRGPLDRYLTAASAAEPEHWPRNAQMAFWVNVYNARVLAGVLDRPGMKSVLDVGKILGVPTLAFFRQKRMSGGRSLTLSHIEHKILREGFGDARVHFVLNCASASCPVLPARALTAERLEADLDQATREFLTDRTRNRIVPGGPLELSEIFKWYRGDFEQESGSVPAYVAAHWPGGITFPAGIDVDYIKYDWSLNGRW